MTSNEAIDNTVRLLQAAERETNLMLMERLEGLADTWLHLAALLWDKEDG